MEIEAQVKASIMLNALRDAGWITPTEAERINPERPDAFLPLTLNTDDHDLVEDLMDDRRLGEDFAEAILCIKRGQSIVASSLIGRHVGPTVMEPIEAAIRA